MTFHPTDALDCEYLIRRGIERRCVVARREIDELGSMVTVLSVRPSFFSRERDELEKLSVSLVEAKRRVDEAIAAYDVVPEADNRGAEGLEMEAVL